MKKSLILAAASLAAISCSKRAMEIEDPTSANEVRFSTGSATITKVTTDASGHSAFDVNDQIGVYAVLDGKKLGTDATTAFPNTTTMQYLDKRFKVTSVSTSSTPSVATFEPNTAGTDNMYYLPGGQAWNYYAYYPTTGGTLFSGMPTVASAAAATNFVKTDNTNTFYNQTTLSSSTGYPGPILFAYYGTADKAVASGQTQPAVQLPFKHALAKLSLDVTFPASIGQVSSAGEATIMMYGTGLTKGITFDLTKATAVGTSTGVYEVISQTSGGTNLDGTTTATGGVTPTYSNTNAYFFEAIPDQTNKQHFTVTGYLVPAGCQTSGAGSLSNVEIKFYIGAGTNLQSYTAKLDKSQGGGKNYLAKIEPGKEYKFKIELNQEEVKFTGTIEDWTAVDETSTAIPAE